MTPTTSRSRLAGAVTLLGLAGLVSTAGVGTFPATAGAATVGPAEITQVGSPTLLRSGGSATPFGMALPEGASCPGDSAHDGYRVDSYLVPKGSSPTEVNYGSGIPDRWYGFFSYGRYFGAANTAENSGAIVGIPTSFSWSQSPAARLLPGGVHSATWEGGIACADVHGNVTTYWDTEIVFTADPSDPGGFTWRVVHERPLPASSDRALWIGIGLLVVASLSAAYALHLRRRATHPGADPPRQDPGDGSGPDDDVRAVVPQHSG